ncbi:MAG: type II toxin-antitoxin system RelE/ParE family toxin [Bacteroidota bacterium]
MEVHFTRRFEKQLDSIKDEKLRKEIDKAIRWVERAKTTKTIPSIKKLRNAKNSYRIRIGDFRIGLLILSTDVIFMDMDHRKDFYRRFP